MRVVGGRLKGRNLASPSSREIRPTADRLRESVFNILIHAYDNPMEGERVLDLFAGTGALGIEATSRGAAFTLFVDNGAEARALLRNNVEALGFVGVRKVYRRDATDLGPAHPVKPGDDRRACDVITAVRTASRYRSASIPHRSGGRGCTGRNSACLPSRATAHSSLPA